MRRGAGIGMQEEQPHRWRSAPGVHLSGSTAWGRDRSRGACHVRCVHTAAIGDDDFSPSNVTITLYCAGNLPFRPGHRSFRIYSASLTGDQDFMRAQTCQGVPNPELRRSPGPPTIWVADQLLQPIHHVLQR
jgi:hypothetical protein